MELYTATGKTQDEALHPHGGCEGTHLGRWSSMAALRVCPVITKKLLAYSSSFCEQCPCELIHYQGLGAICEYQDIESSVGAQAILKPPHWSGGCHQRVGRLAHFFLSAQQARALPEPLCRSR